MTDMNGSRFVCLSVERAVISFECPYVTIFTRSQCVLRIKNSKSIANKQATSKQAQQHPKKDHPAAESFTPSFTVDSLVRVCFVELSFSLCLCVVLYCIQSSLYKYINKQTKQTNRQREEREALSSFLHFIDLIVDC